MCSQYPEIIITSPKEPAVFCPVPQTVQENLLTTNYEQWCALYSMDDDNISLAYVSNDLQRQRQQRYEEEEYEYGREYRYEYNDFEEDDFFEKYETPSKRQTLGDEFCSYNETHTQKYQGYDNTEFEYYDEYEDDEGFDYEYAYESDRDYDDDDEDEIFYMEKEYKRSVERPRLNYDILANAISRRFKNTTDSDVSEEEDEEVDEFETETIVVKDTPAVKIASDLATTHRNFFQAESIKGNKEGKEMFDYMETIKNKYSQKDISSSLPTKSGFSIMNDVFNEGHIMGMPEAMSNKHGARSPFLTHRKSSSLQGSILEKAINNSNLSSMIKRDCEMILSGPMKNRKRAFSLNERPDFHSVKSVSSDLKKVLFCF